MKILYIMLLFFPSLVFAEDIESWETLLTGTLKTLNGFAGMTLPQQIMFVVVLGCLALALLTLGILAVAKYFRDKNQREIDAYNEALRIKKIQEDNLQKMQKDATDALIENMDIAYKQDYDYYIEQIKKANYKAIYAKTAPQYQEQIAAFLYKDDLTPEQRSARVINIVRRKNV